MSRGLVVVAHRMINGVDSFPLLAVPFFILAGNLMNTAGITERIFDFAKALIGWLPGGLGHVNIGASVIFAGMSGAAVADAGGLGAIEIKAMRDANYDAGLRGRHHRRLVDHRADHPAVAADGDLRRGGRRLDRPAVRRRLHARPADGRGADGDGRDLRPSRQAIRATRPSASAHLGAAFRARSCR